MGSCTLHLAAKSFTPGCRHLHPAAKSFPPGCTAIYTRLPPFTPGCCHHYTRRCQKLSIRLRRHLHPAAATLHSADAASTRMYYIRKSAATIPPECIASGIMTPDGREERFNFHNQTYPDPPIALTRRILQQFCIVPRCSPEASRYVQQTSLDIFL